MIISIKNSIKLVGLIVVSFCAVFVCTFFLNFYLDALTIEGLLSDPSDIALYNAQLATAKFICAVSGVFLALIAIVMLAFYIKLYIDGHLTQLGILKAMGYSNAKIALVFCVFGASVLVGTSLGFGCGFIIMPAIYKNMTIDGLPEIPITFHPWLLFALVFAPAGIFSVLSFACALMALRRPVSEMLRCTNDKENKSGKVKDINERSFLIEMCLKTIGSKKSLAFFVAFACFCFSSMVQMSVSMLDLSSGFMGLIILLIGVVLAATTLFMAITSLVNSNVKNVAIMKAFGYTMKECSLAVLGGYHIFALVGFAVGTVYQFGLLKLMVNVVFKDVAIMPEYSFNVSAFFITFAIFAVLYELIMLFYTFKLNKISVKEVMTEI